MLGYRIVQTQKDWRGEVKIWIKYWNISAQTWRISVSGYHLNPIVSQKFHIEFAKESQGYNEFVHPKPKIVK